VKPQFKIFEHPSDLGIEARGRTMAEAFQNASLGLMSVIAGTSKIESSEVRTISVKALDRENLLVRWLTEILFVYDAEKFLTADVTIETATDTALHATLRGQYYDASKHELSIDVKAVTYHQLSVEQCEGDWIARVVVDI
jgi:SHS2 domain-containing protein